MRRTSLVSGALTLTALAALAAACDSPSAPGAPAPVPATTRYECRADVAARTVTCSVPTPSGARGDVLLGNQGVHVRLTSSNVAVVADSFMFDETVTNLLNVPIGTTDGTTPDSDGVQVFFTGPISTTAGTGTVDVANADGVGTFTASNQPFFAYHEVIAPSATSAAKRWKLRFDPGVQHFTFSLLVSAPYPPGSGSVHMTVLAPRADSAQEDSMPILVQIDSSSASVASVVATAAGRTAVLYPSSPGRMSGVLDLTGIPAQTLELRVLATTVNGDTGVALRSFIKDARPRLAIAAPVPNAVARPNLRLDVDCTDDEPTGCASVTVQVAGDFGTQQVASGTTSVHATVSLASFDGQGVEVRVRGTDSRGRTRLTPVFVYVEASPALVAVDSAGTMALDLDSTRLLYLDLDGSVRIHDRVAASQTVLATGKSQAWPGYLHPQGAIFAYYDLGQTSNLYDWRAGSLNLLGPESGVSFAGDWAAWGSPIPGTVYRRDLAGGSTVTVATQASNDPGVAPNGDVVYTSLGPSFEENPDRYDVYRYRDGTTTRLTADVDSLYRNFAPLTDGTSVLFLKENRKHTGAAPPYYVTLSKDGNVSLLSGMSFNLGGERSYQAAGGWIAYLWTDGAGVQQVRTRSPLGDDVQVTHAAADCRIMGLGSDGTLVYATGATGPGASTYVVRAPYTGTHTRVGRDWGTQLRFRGTELIYLLGNAAFHVSY